MLQGLLFGAAAFAFTTVAAASPRASGEEFARVKLSSPGWLGETGSDNAVVSGCSYALSREAVAIIDRDIIGRALLRDLSVACPLSPSLDVYLPLRQLKQRSLSSVWECRACAANGARKRFKSEDYVDAHITTSHADLIAADEEQRRQRNCLADFCPLLGCPSLSTAAAGYNYSKWLTYLDQQTQGRNPSPAAIPAASRFEATRSEESLGAGEGSESQKNENDIPEQHEKPLSLVFADEAANVRSKRRSQYLRADNSKNKAVAPSIKASPSAEELERAKLLQSYRLSCQRLMDACVAPAAHVTAVRNQDEKSAQQRPQLRSSVSGLGTAEAFRTYLYDEFCEGLSIETPQPQMVANKLAPMATLATPAAAPVGRTRSLEFQGGFFASIFAGGDNNGEDTTSSSYFFFETPLGRVVYALLILVFILLAIAGAVAIGAALGVVPEEMNFPAAVCKALFDAADSHVRLAHQETSKQPWEPPEGDTNAATFADHGSSTAVARGSQRGTRLRGRDLIRRTLDRSRSREKGASHRAHTISSQLADDTDYSDTEEGAESDDDRSSEEDNVQSDGESAPSPHESNNADYRPAMTHRAAKLLTKKRL
jgi:hypothetical protein